MRTLSVVLLALASCACGQQAPGLVGASPLSVEALKPAPRPLGCTFYLSTDVKGFALGTTVKAMASPSSCPEVLVQWTLLTNPDGVVYRRYLTHADLLAGTVAPHGAPSKYLRLEDFIAENAVCFEATDGLSTQRVGLVGTPQEVCDGL